MTAGESAASLLERFAVWGCYQDRMLDGRPCALRSRLEIFDCALEPSRCLAAPADLVAIMMNPGGSRPLGPLDAEGWAPAVPDRTQYQLMKLALRARAQGWPLRHIRVINLSDLRTPKSAELFAALAGLEDDRHSLFSPRRAGDLAAALGPADVPVLRAWGLAKALARWAQAAVAATASRRVLGLTDDDLFYRHPLPQRADLQLAWLCALEAQLAT